MSTALQAVVAAAVAAAAASAAAAAPTAGLKTDVRSQLPPGDSSNSSNATSSEHYSSNSMELAS
jgi:predicted porin